MTLRRALLLLVLLLLPVTAHAVEIDLYDPQLDIGAVDFAGVYAPADEAELSAYLWACRAAHQRAIPLLLCAPLDEAALEAAAMAIDWTQVRWTALPDEGNGRRMLLSCDETPGAQAAAAYLRGDVDALDAEARALLDILPADAVARERAIYDHVQRRSAGNRMDDCDAFTMLCEVAGLEAYTVLSATDAWNVIQLDGVWLAVDPSYGADGAEGFPYLYFNAGLDLLPDTAAYLRGPTSPGPVAETTEAHYAYGNAAFPELGRAENPQALREAIIARAARDGDISDVVWYCDAFDEDIEAFLEALATPTAEAAYLPMPGQGMQSRVGGGLFLQLPLTLVDLTAPHDAGYAAAGGAFDLHSGNLDIATMDYYALALIETEDALLAMLADARRDEAAQIPLRLAAPLDEQAALTLCGAFDWAMVSLQSMPNRAGETHALLTCTYLSGVRIARAYRDGNTAPLTAPERAAHDIAAAFFRDAYPAGADAVARERAIYDFVQASSDYWVGKPQARRVEDVCTAVDVLVNGRSNCAGFADAFWMLCDMAGFDVRNVPGTLDGQPHMWNLIALDGTWYMVDATKSVDAAADENQMYVFFNAGRDLMAGHYVWRDDLLPAHVADGLDGMYPYGNEAFPGYARVADADTLRAGLLATGGQTHWRCDAFDGDLDALLQAVAADGAYVTGGSWMMEGDALYLYAETP